MGNDIQHKGRPYIVQGLICCLLVVTAMVLLGTISTSNSSQQLKGLDYDDSSSRTLRNIHHSDEVEGKDHSSSGITTGVKTSQAVDQVEDADEGLKIEFDEATITAMAKQLEPHKFKQIKNEDGSLVLTQHQFLHMHHMKTAGTSMDHVINCGMKRLTSMANGTRLSVPYANIHECSAGRYEVCLAGETDSGKKCRDNIAKSAILSYCAPLYDLDVYGWTKQDQDEEENKIKALTVLRHPVNRVWSMYRFRTSPCYDCRELIDVYSELDKKGTFGKSDMCGKQLTNHMTNNLLSSHDTEGMTDDEKVEEAIHNMKHFFTMIGLTEKLATTMDLVGYTFPWLNETMEGTTLTCPLPHANSSPSHNRCASAHHEQPDDATREVIEAHNQLDMRVYDAALEHFELQKQALDYIRHK